MTSFIWTLEPWNEFEVAWLISFRFTIFDVVYKSLLCSHLEKVWPWHARNFQGFLLLSYSTLCPIGTKGFVYSNGLSRRQAPFRSFRCSLNKNESRRLDNRVEKREKIVETSSYVMSAFFFFLRSPWVWRYAMRAISPFKFYVAVFWPGTKLKVLFAHKEIRSTFQFDFLHLFITFIKKSRQKHESKASHNTELTLFL